MNVINVPMTEQWSNFRFSICYICTIISFAGLKYYFLILLSHSLFFPLPSTVLSGILDLAFSILHTGGKNGTADTKQTQCNCLKKWSVYVRIGCGLRETKVRTDDKITDILLQTFVSKRVLSKVITHFYSRKNNTHSRIIFLAPHYYLHPCLSPKNEVITGKCQNKALMYRPNRHLPGL